MMTTMMIWMRPSGYYDDQEEGTEVEVSFVPLSLPPLAMFQLGTPIRRWAPESLAVLELGLSDWGTHQM